MSRHVAERAERAVLGSILLEPELMWTARGQLEVGDFGWSAGSTIYESMMGMCDRRERVDIVALTETMRRADTLDRIGGGALLSQLADEAVTATQFEGALTAVVNASLLRQTERFAQQLAAGARGSVPDVRAFLNAAEHRLQGIVRARDPHRPQVLKTVLRETLADIERAVSTGGVLGIETGFAQLDRVTTGLHPSELVILGARPGMGKSALATCIAANVAASGTPVAVFSLEMGNRQIGARLLSLTSRVPLWRYRRGLMDQAAWDATLGAAEQMYEWPIFLDQTSALAPSALTAKARALRYEHNVGLVIVDYLGLMRVQGKRDLNREREIAEISQSLKALAMELEIPVLGLSQLNRALERRDDKRPQLHDLRDSGSLEQDADVVLFLYRDEYYDGDSEDQGVAELLVAKQRQGESGVTMRLGFDPGLTRFYDLDEEVAHDAA